MRALSGRLLAIGELLAPIFKTPFIASASPLADKPIAYVVGKAQSKGYDGEGGIDVTSGREGRATRYEQVVHSVNLAVGIDDAAFWTFGHAKRRDMMICSAQFVSDRSLIEQPVGLFNMSDPGRFEVI